MTSTDIIQYTPKKKDIEAMAVRDVGILIEDGFSDAAAELIMAMRLETYFATRAKALRPYALAELREDRAKTVIGSTIEKAKEAGRWEFNDPYLTELENEVAAVKEKAKLTEERLRTHVTLAGEITTITPAYKREGGETVRVKL